MARSTWQTMGIVALALGTCNAAAVLAASAAQAVAPAFDCTRADSAATRLVCADPDLAELDREMTRLFRLADRGPHMSEARRRELRAYQRGWIRGRDDCWKAADLRACVLDSYLLRIFELRQGYADARAEDAKGISAGPKALECEGFDAGIGVGFVNGRVAHAYLRWRDKGVALTAAPAASGARYLGAAFDGNYVLWTQGDGARFERPDAVPLNCRIVEPG